ncbi:hypothetical protein OUZ56_011709 [Daphnia magna]|uniref:Uncharacterized protein n=1 Tax=Daphnia magna TaxID=35525 RepID=A0ABQ9Z0X6_9CRUS|nr:hypothetical protein OUZ56_011709 [Daphnia magna]
MEEKQITDKGTWELPPRPCPCSLLGPLPAVLVLYQCPSFARRFQPVRCFRPARGSCPARRSTPSRRFPQSVLLPALSAEIQKKNVNPCRRQSSRRCPSPARRLKPVLCFRPSRGSRPARRFHPSVLLPALSAQIRKKKVKPNRRQFEPFSGRKRYVNPLEPMEARALEQKGTIS